MTSLCRLTKRRTTKPSCSRQSPDVLRIISFAFPTCPYERKKKKRRRNRGGGAERTGRRAVQGHATLPAAFTQPAPTVAMIRGELTGNEITSTEYARKKENEHPHAPRAHTLGVEAGYHDAPPHGEQRLRVQRPHGPLPPMTKSCVAPNTWRLHAAPTRDAAKTSVR